MNISVTPATARKAVVGVTVATLLSLLSWGFIAQAADAQQLAAQPNAVRQQLAQAGQSAPAPAKPAAPVKPAAAPATAQTKPNSTAQVKPVAAPGKPATASATADKKAAAEPKAAARRDPFSPLFTNRPTTQATGLPEHLPPGIAGLQIATLHVDGVVSSPNGMIAIVSNPQQRVYFLHEGDRLYDGTVQHISLEMIAFHETGKDPFGKPVDREVSKMLLNATPGEEAP